MLRLLLGAALLLAYALPLFAPPIPEPPTVSNGLVASLFPGLPTFWVLARLVAAIVGAVVLGSALVPSTRSDQGSPRATDRSAVADAFATTVEGWLVPVATLVAVWVIVGVGPAWHSPWAANQVDAWSSFDRFLELAGQGPGHGGDGHAAPLALLLQGLPVARMLPSAAGLGLVQALAAWWLAVTALAIGWIATVTLGRVAATVCVAIFLFSPWTKAMLISPAPLFYPPLLVAGLAVAVVLVRRRASAVTLAALAAIAGLAAAEPALLPAALLALVAATMAIVARGSSTRWTTIALVFAVLLAALAAGSRGGSALTGADAGRSSLSTAAQLGQLPSGNAADDQTVAGSGHPAATAVLAPLETPRSPTRTIGDTMLDPVGAALALVGIVLCIARVTEAGGHAGLLLLLVATLLPGLAGNSAAGALARIDAAVVPLSLLSAVAISALLTTLAQVREHRGAPAPAVASVTVVAIVAGGIYVGDVVNPDVLRSAAMTLAVEAYGATTQSAAVLSDRNPDTDRSSLRTMATALPRTSMQWMDVNAIDRTEHHAPSLLFWSPVIEHDAKATERICRQWPHARLMVVFDRTRRSLVHVADVDASDWMPRLAAARWQEQSCSEGIRAAREESERADRWAGAAGASPGGTSGRRGPRYAAAGGTRAATGREHPDLSRGDLRGAALGGKELNEANMRGADLTGADLQGTKLNGANLEQADLSDANLTGADLSGADLRGANVDGTILANAQLVDAKLTGLDLTATDLNGANLNRADLSAAKLEGADLSSTNLYEAKLTDANLKATRMGGLNLHGADLAGADAGAADLRMTDLSEADLREAHLDATELEGATLKDADLRDADLSFSKLVGAHLDGARLRGSKLDEADLHGVGLAEAKLRRASLRNADLSGADLSGADLLRADWGGADLTGVTWAGSTCPDGTNSDDNGGTCCDHHVGDAPASCGP